jgi:hypothetical protein
LDLAYDIFVLIGGGDKLSKDDFIATFERIGIKDSLFVDHLFTIWDSGTNILFIYNSI